MYESAGEKKGDCGSSCRYGDCGCSCWYEDGSGGGEYGAAIAMGGEARDGGEASDGEAALAIGYGSDAELKEGGSAVPGLL